MRGIVLAGGTGSRLGALTRRTNKHVLPVYDRAMLAWPIRTLRGMRCQSISIVTSGVGVHQLRHELGAADYDWYAQGAEATGVAAALKCAYEPSEDWCAVALGDNVFLDEVPTPSVAYDGAHCFLSRRQEVAELAQLGVATFFFDRIRRIVEKPVDPPSNFAVTGLYVFGPGVWRKLQQLQPSARGELEITDLLNLYAEENKLDYTTLEGFWGDAGTPDGLLECANACRKWVKR